MMKPTLFLLVAVFPLLLLHCGCASGPSSEVVGARSAAKSAAADLEKRLSTLPVQEQPYWKATLAFLNWYGKDIPDAEAADLGLPDHSEWEDPFASLAFWRWGAYSKSKAAEDRTAEVVHHVLKAAAGAEQAAEFKLVHNRSGASAIWPLAGLRHVKVVDLSDCEIEPESFSAIARLAELESLKLERCQVKNLEFLAQCKQLRELSIAECRSIKSVEPLAGLQALRALNLNACTAIESIQPILCMDASVDFLNVEGSWGLLLTAIRGLPEGQSPRARLHISTKPLGAQQFGDLQAELTARPWSRDLPFRVIAGSTAVKANAVPVSWPEPASGAAEASGTRGR